MTIEDVIYSLEVQAQDKDRLAGGDPNSYLTKEATALYEAIRMLRAKLDRSQWKGCVHCRMESPLCELDDTVISMAHYNIIGGPAINVDGIGAFHVEFCPICGRPLTEEAWEELEGRINGGATD